MAGTASSVREPGPTEIEMTEPEVSTRLESTDSVLPQARNSVADSSPARPQFDSGGADKRFRLINKIGGSVVTIAGIFLIVLTVTIGLFLLYKGSFTFTAFQHSVGEFLFSSDWEPQDSPDLTLRGSVGALIFILGSLMTCFLGLTIAMPFAVGAAVFITEIAPRAGERLFRPAVELFLGIPSVVYGWVGVTVLVPFIRAYFPPPEPNNHPWVVIRFWRRVSSWRS